MSEDGIELLQNWYVAHCDGEWEHEFELRIRTYDNPGWGIEIDIRADPRFETLDELTWQNEEDDNDWIHIMRRDGKIKAACGPRNLSRAIRLLLRETPADLG